MNYLMVPQALSKGKLFKAEITFELFHTGMDHQMGAQLLAF